MNFEYDVFKTKCLWQAVVHQEGEHIASSSHTSSELAESWAQGFMKALEAVSMCKGCVSDMEDALSDCEDEQPVFGGQTPISVPIKF